MKSMTGFGSASSANSAWSVSVEVSSVNKKGLEISVSLPRSLASLETVLAEKVREFYSRAKVNLNVKLTRLQNEETPLANVQLKFAFDELRKKCESLGANFNPDARLVFELEACLEKRGESEFSEEELAEISALIQQCAIDALKSAEIMRLKEGANLREDFLQRLARMAELANRLQELSAFAPARRKELLQKRLASLGLTLDSDDERLSKEIAIFADKVDISEEIARLRSHIIQFENLMESSESVGRKLDFLAQEFNREANTTSSKSASIEITDIALELKSEIERIREQAQNIE